MQIVNRSFEMNKFLIFFLFCIFRLSAIDASPESISKWVAGTKKAIIEKSGWKEENLLFLVFWNFDNTILDGDTTEGSVDLYGNVIFKGLAQVAIESGFSKKYSSFPKYLKDYEAMEKTDEPKAFAYAAQILAGAEEAKVLQLSTQYFANTLKPHLFQESIDLIRELQKQKISIQVITASPRIFVQGAAPILNISIEDVHGMETVVKNGRLTDQMILPLTTRNGKIEKIKQIVQEKLRQYKGVYVLAGVGNYNLNDMPFLEWVAAQQLPAGKPLAAIDYRPPRIPLDNVVLFPLREEISDYKP